MSTEIVPGVHDITVREDANGRRYRAYLVEDDGEVRSASESRTASGGVPTLFDAGLPDTTDALFEGIESAGLALLKSYFLDTLRSRIAVRQVEN
ncbi:hypothetical protein ACFQE8_07775 [Salinirubellus sp. GCM10025818]|uniref:hypothetical protein n=1 Tax=Salinirubellus TaxID=2162630 RepID=UPI0030D4960C